MQNFTPIPSPPAQRWHEFRLRGLPILVFLAAATGVAVLWNGNIGQATITGIVEPIQLTVNSPVAGTIAELAVDRFQVVQSGTPIARICPADFRSEIDIMRQQLELLRLSHEPELALQSSALDYQKLRLSWLDQKVSLATAQVNFQFAQAEFDRASKLMGGSAITGQSFELRREKKDALAAEAAERAQLVSELGQQLETLRAPASLAGYPQELKTLIASQEDKIRSLAANLRERTVTAPVDAMVVGVLRRAGEIVKEGEPLIQLKALHSQRIIGYVRQPLAVEPKAGMRVEVRSRTEPHTRALSRIASVGVGFELIPNPDQRLAAIPETGLPVEIPVPPGMVLRPGETVDLVFASSL